MSDNNLIDEWLETGTTKRETVNLYSDQAVMNEMAALIEERDELDKERAAKGNRPAVYAMGESDPARALDAREADLEAREAALWQRYEASKAEWTVRAVTPDEAIGIRNHFPIPNAPKSLPADAPDKAKAGWEKQLALWRITAEKAEIERQVAMVTLAVVEVRKGDRVVTTVTEDQVRAMLSRAYGAQRIKQLVNAIDVASTAEKEMSRPKSLSGSESTAE